MSDTPRTTRPDPVPTELVQWVARNQRYLDGLLRNAPDRYVSERKRLTEEYEAKVRALKQ